jgi:hypothetical protein
LKLVADEYKKKQNLFKNKEDSKKIYDELCKKYVNRLFWEDLERPYKLNFDPNDNAYLNYILKKGAAIPTSTTGTTTPKVESK